MAFPLVPGRGVGITMAPLQQVKLALANYLAVRGSQVSLSCALVLCALRDAVAQSHTPSPTRCHFEVFSQSVSQLFHGRPPAYRPRAASLTSSASLKLHRACHARLLPAAPRVKHKFQREYSATRSRGRLNYIASEVVLSPGFSPSMQGDPCRSLPLLAYCSRVGLC